MGGTDPVEFWDPHFHLWDTSPGTASGHDPEQLFAPDGDPRYGLNRYTQAVTTDGFECVGGAVVEALSVCHPGTAGDAFLADCFAEASWIAAQLSDHRYRIVAAAALEEPGARQHLDRLAALDVVVGIRQILNHEPSWPRNQYLGDLLENPAWQDGFHALADFGFRFDLQLNPHQYHAAARLAARRPDVPIMIDHLGSPTLADLHEGTSYWDGMAALADCEQVSIKISMLSYVDPQWPDNALVRETVLGLVELFGPSRCCVASNFPVEAAAGWSAQRLLGALGDLFTQAGDADRRALFAGSARRFYTEG